MSVQSMSRTLQYLSSRNTELINPTQTGSEQEVFIATNSKTYMKLRQQAAPLSPTPAPEGAGGESSSRTNSAVIALAVVCGFGVAGAGVANFAGRRKKEGFAVTRGGRTTSTVEMGSVPSTSATDNPAYAD